LNAQPWEKRLLELAKRARFAAEAQFTRFLEPDKTAFARHAARENGVEVTFWGGHEDAERVVAAFSRDGEVPKEDFPVSVMRVNYNAKYASVGHRDLMGALMALGLVREAFGDLAAEEGRALFAVENDVADYVTANFESAGRASVKCVFAEPDEAWPEPEGVRFRETVPSVRMDAVLAAGYDLSRQQAQNLIRSGAVKRNHVEDIHTDRAMEDGDLLSVRGYGRLKLEQVVGETRKGRVAIRLFRYGK